MNGNGYMKAYHCILDDADRNLRAGEFQVFYFIYRMTIGWNMYNVAISYSEFGEELALSSNAAGSVIEKLEKNGWIHVMRNKTKGGRAYNMYSMGQRVYHPRNLGGLDVCPSPKKLGWSEELLPKKLGQKKQKPPKKVGRSIINKDNSFKDNNINTYHDLLSKLEFFPGIVNLSVENDRNWVAYIQQFPTEHIDIVIEEAKRRSKLPEKDKDKLHRKAVLKFVAGGLDHFQRFYGKEDDSKQYSNIQYEQSLDRVKEMQEQVKRDKEAAGGEEAYHTKIRALIAEFEKGGANGK